MACFLAPAALAVVTTATQKVVERKEKEADSVDGSARRSGGKWTQRLRWLNTMLWGGVILLALEHVWHGEVVPWPPFLTAMETPGEVGPMLHELATYGVAMAVAVTAVWAVMVVVAELRAKAEDVSGVESASPSEGA